MPDLPSPGIFLSYRRQDAAPYARLLQYQLRERFPDAQVFMDLDSIEPGLDFVEVIEEALGSCVVLVALIGRQWLTLTDEEGNRRLDNPDDYVRFEVQTALQRGVRVIPVLVDGAAALKAPQLPVELHKLARLSALELSYGRYQFDADRLLDVIQRVLGAVPRPSAAPQPAPEEPADNGPAPVDPERVSRILQDALHSADFITSERWKAVTLAEVAKAMEATDPELADRLNGAAERLTELIDGETDKAEALAGIAIALAPAHLDEAERIAQSITGTGPRAENAIVRTLAHLAKAVAATDEFRARRLIRDAELTALAITDEIYYPSALVAVAMALAAIDRFRAEEVINRMADDSWAAVARAGIAEEVAATDPDWAARLIVDAEDTAQGIATRSPRDRRAKVAAMVSIAKAMAITNQAGAVRLLDYAERTASAITDEEHRWPALQEVAGALAAADPERAERVAQSITDEFYESLALAEVAGAMAATDPARAEHIARSISYGTAGDRALANVAKALAATDPERAERVAQSITDNLWKARALLGLVEA